MDGLILAARSEPLTLSQGLLLFYSVIAGVGLFISIAFALDAELGGDARSAGKVAAVSILWPVAIVAFVIWGVFVLIKDAIPQHWESRWRKPGFVKGDET